MFTGLQLAQLAFALFSKAPELIGELESAIHDHWGKDHVVQAQKGLAAFTQVFNTVGGAITTATDSFAQPSPQMGMAPATPDTPTPVLPAP